MYVVRRSAKAHADRPVKNSFPSLHRALSEDRRFRSRMLAIMIKRSFCPLKLHSYAPSPHPTFRGTGRAYVFGMDSVGIGFSISVGVAFYMHSCEPLDGF